MTARDDLAEIALSVCFEELPSEVVHQAKRIVLDTLGCAYGAIGSDPARIVSAAAQEIGSAASSSASVIGSSRKTSPALATLINGTLIRFLNANDYYFGRNGSHASGNLAAALAIAEATGASGAALIEALVAAYEIQFRFCDHAGDPNIWDRGWHHATHVQFASAATAAKLLGLDVRNTAEAIAIAATSTNTLAELQRGIIPLIKASAEANVAKAGVEAAILAKHGLTGPDEIIEGRFGWANTVAGSVNLEGLLAPTDGRYRIMDTCTKPYAAEFMTQAAIQAAIEVVSGNDIKMADVADVEARFHEYAFNKPSWDPKKLRPTNRETADHSFPYCIAVAMLERDCSPEQFREELLFSPEASALMDRIRLVPDPELTALWPRASGAAIKVTLSNGKIYESVCRHQPGHPQNRESDDMLEAKFRRMSHHVLTPDRQAKLIEAIWNLDKLRVEDLCALLRSDLDDVVSRGSEEPLRSH